MNLTDEVRKHIKGATFISIDTLTTVTLTGGKSNPQQGRITKKMEGANCMLFQNKHLNGYEQMIRRRLEQEGKNPDSFQLGERAWGTRIPNTPFVEHKGKEYLEVIFLRPGKVSYFLDGQPIDKHDVNGLKDHQEGEQGGLNDKVIIRTFAIENITKLTIDKRTLIN